MNETRGRKRSDGFWEIDGNVYERVGVAGRADVDDDLPIIWGDPYSLRHPLAIADHQINYAAELAILYSWRAFRGSYARTNQSPQSLKLGTNLTEVSSGPGPYLVRDNGIVVRSDGNALAGAITTAHDEDLLELVLESNCAFLFFEEEMQLASIANLIILSSFYGTSSVGLIPPHSYEDYGHPGRVCDPDGGIVIGGL